MRSSAHELAARVLVDYLIDFIYRGSIAMTNALRILITP